MGVHLNSACLGTCACDTSGYRGLLPRTSVHACAVRACMCVRVVYACMYIHVCIYACIYNLCACIRAFLQTPAGSHPNCFGSTLMRLSTYIYICVDLHVNVSHSLAINFQAYTKYIQTFHNVRITHVCKIHAKNGPIPAIKTQIVRYELGTETCT